MKPQASIDLDDIGSSFIEALKVWARYLDGKQGWDSRAAAAHQLFTGGMGAAWSPGRAPTDEEMQNLELLAPVMDTWKIMPNLFTPRIFRALLGKFKPAIEYVESTMGVKVAATDVYAPRPHSHLALPAFDWLAKHAEYHNAAETVMYVGGVAAREDNSQPPGFPIKGNMDSMKYHHPEGRWYKQTVAEVWFADEESARKAGFEPAG